MPQPSREERIERCRAQSRKADDQALTGKKEEALEIVRSERDAAAAAGDEDYRFFFEAETIAFSEPDYPAQIALLERAIAWGKSRDLPEDFFLLRNMGTHHSLKGDEDAAIEWFDKALAVNAEDSDAMRQRGVSLSKKGDLDAAIEWFDKALAVNPEDSDAMHNRGVSLSKKGDLDAAIEWFDKALAVNPDDFHAMRNRGVVHFWRGRMELALRDIGEAAKLKPEAYRDDFYFVCREAGRDPEEEWKKLFADMPGPTPDLGAEEPGRPELTDIQSFIRMVRDAYEPQSDIFLKQKAEAEGKRKNFLRTESRLDPSRTAVMVLRRWNSYTPAVPTAGEEQSRGGGYFIWHNGRGTVIDPGYDFLRNFCAAGCRLRDVDNVVLTHAHNDHTMEFETLRTLLHEYNDQLSASERAKHGKKVRFYLNNGSFMRFSGTLNMRDDDFTQCLTTLNPGQEIDMGGGLKMRVLPAHHDEVLARDQAVGLLFTLTGEEDERRLLFTGDTGLFPLKRDTAHPEPDPAKGETWQGYGLDKCGPIDLLIVHIGSIKPEELKRDIPPAPREACYPNHLGIIGTSRLITVCRPRLAVVSEFGEEMRDFRIDLVKALNEKVIGPYCTRKGIAPVPRVVPGDLPFVYDPMRREFCCFVGGGWASDEKIEFAGIVPEKEAEKVVYFYDRDAHEADRLRTTNRGDDWDRRLKKLADDFDKQRSDDHSGLYFATRE